MERNYRPGYVYRRLCEQYGGEVLRQLGITSRACDWDSRQSASLPTADVGAQLSVPEGRPKQPGAVQQGLEAAASSGRTPGRPVQRWSSPEGRLPYREPRVPGRAGLPLRVLPR